LINTIVGIRQTVDPDLHDSDAVAFPATRWQMFTRLEVPAALPVLFGGSEDQRNVGGDRRK